MRLTSCEELVRTNGKPSRQGRWQEFFQGGANSRFSADFFQGERGESVNMGIFHKKM